MRQSTRARGFTLVELLIVVLIIVVLISILIPTVSRIRSAAHVANSKSQMSQIVGAIERYYQEQHQYPGPLDDGMLATQERGLTVPNIYEADGTTPLQNRVRITQAENLAVGLFGGMKWVPNAGGARLCFDPQMVGRGMVGMNPAVPKKFSPYLEDTKMLSPMGPTITFYSDGAGQASDSGMPEILDKFPSPMPILYLRGHPGKDGVVANNRPDPPTGTIIRRHYDLSDIYPYTMPDLNGNYIGEGKRISLRDYVAITPVPTAPSKLPHGLVDAHAPSNRPSTIIKGDKSTPSKTYSYPFDAWPYLRDPATPYIITGTGTQADDAANTPRAKNRFILIGAGLDRVYGTPDDICSFGDVMPTQ